MTVRFIHGDTIEMLRTLPADSVHCIVTSPPFFGLRDYGVEGQYGLEPTLAEYVERMVEVGRELRRVLRPDGVMWWEHGDSYAANRPYQVPDSKHCDVGNNLSSRVPCGLKPKDLIGQPWRVSFAFQEDGWYLRAANIWHKPNTMPESVTDRTTTAHSYVFLFAKSERYFYDAEAVKEAGSGRNLGNVSTHKHNDGTERNRTKAGLLNVGPASTRNLRSVWTIASAPFAEAHFATFPPALAETCIKAGTSEHGCCQARGAPWARVVDAQRVIDKRPMTTGAKKRAALGEMARTTPQGRTCGSMISTTTGWKQSCTCPPADPVPCTVLDPFSGAGTTVMVADRLGRDAIGIELNPDYIAIAERRISADRLQRGDGTMDDVAKAMVQTPIEEMIARAAT